jgi:hypothetical protein
MGFRLPVPGQGGNGPKIDLAGGTKTSEALYRLLFQPSSCM